MEALNSQTSTNTPVLKIEKIEILANKAKISTFKSDITPDWTEIKTLSGATRLVFSGTTTESFVIKIEWITFLAGELYKELSKKLKDLCISGHLLTVVFPDTSVKTRCALTVFDEEITHDKQGQIKKCSYTLKFKCENG